MDIVSFFRCNNDIRVMILCAVARVCMSQILKCDDGWIRYKDKCYYFSDIDNLQKSRDDALTYCHDNSSYLVAVTDADINEFVYNTKTYNDSYWIGLRPFAQDKWGWNDGSIAENITWSFNEPDNNRPCVRIRDSLFYDKQCRHNDRAVCETERDTEPEATGTWTSYNGHWYMLTNKMSHLAAAKVCLSHGGYLARLTTDVERKLDIIPAKTMVWTGLTRLVWDGGSGYNWHFWSGEHTNEHPINTLCTALGSGTGSWKSQNCQEEYYFICNREPSVEMPPATFSIRTVEETTAVFHTAQSTNSMRRTDVTFKTSTMTIDGRRISESTQISPEDRVLQYVLFAIYAMVVLMLLVDSVLLVIYMKLRKSSRSQVDDKSQIREADSAPVDNNVYSDVDDFILPTDLSNGPIY